MPESNSSNRAVVLAVVLAALAGVTAAALILDFDPFADDDPPAGDYLASGDEICAEAQREFVDAQRTPPRTPADAAELTSDLADVAEEEIAQLRELTVPAQLRTDAERYLAAREEGVALLRAGVKAAEDEDPGTYEDLQAQLERTQPVRHRLARKVGFTECSRPLAPPDGG